MQDGHQSVPYKSMDVRLILQSFASPNPFFWPHISLTTSNKDLQPRIPEITASENYYSNFKIQITNYIIFNKIDMNIITLIKRFEGISWFLTTKLR